MLQVVEAFRRMLFSNHKYIDRPRGGSRVCMECGLLWSTNHKQWLILTIAQFSLSFVVIIFMFCDLGSRVLLFLQTLRNPQYWKNHAQGQGTHQLGHAYLILGWDCEWWLLVAELLALFVWTMWRSLTGDESCMARLVLVCLCSWNTWLSVVVRCELASFPGPRTRLDVSGSNSIMPPESAGQSFLCLKYFSLLQRTTKMKKDLAKLEDELETNLRKTAVTLGLQAATSTTVSDSGETMTASYICEWSKHWALWSGHEQAACMLPS